MKEETDRVNGFSAALQQDTKCSLKLQNLTNGLVAFKIKTTNIKRYGVR